MRVYSVYNELGAAGTVHAGTSLAGGRFRRSGAGHGEICTMAMTRCGAERRMPMRASAPVDPMSLLRPASVMARPAASEGPSPA